MLRARVLLVPEVSYGVRKRAWRRGKRRWHLDVVAQVLTDAEDDDPFPSLGNAVFDHLEQVAVRHVARMLEITDDFLQHSTPLCLLVALRFVAAKAHHPPDVLEDEELGLLEFDEAYHLEVEPVPRVFLTPRGIREAGALTRAAA